MTKSEKLIHEAREMIDDGFDSMGRSIKNPSMLDRYLVAATSKAVRFSDAILVLCNNKLTDEAFPVLRSLIEHSINMRWITQKDSTKRLREYMNDFSEKGFGAPWTDKKLDERMEEVGFGDRDYYDFCVKITYSYAHVNASSLKWSEVIDHPQLSKERWSPDAIYQVVVQMLGHVMKALDSRFEGHFSGYNAIWKQIKVDKDIRNKIEKVRESFKQPS